MEVEWDLGVYVNHFPGEGGKGGDSNKRQAYGVRRFFGGKVLVGRTHPSLDRTMLLSRSFIFWGSTTRGRGGLGCGGGLCQVDYLIEVVCSN